MTTEVDTTGKNNPKNGDLENGSATSPTAWVHFEEETTAPAVINTESVQVNLERSNNNALSVISEGNISTIEPKPLSTITLQVETVRQGFCKYSIVSLSIKQTIDNLVFCFVRV